MALILRSEVLDLLHPKFGAAGLGFDSGKAAGPSKQIV
jgi:hypothetical protein